MNQDNLYEVKKKALSIGIPALIIIIAIIIFNPFVVIEGGEVGVKMTWGEVSKEVLEEGLHFVIPHVQKVIKVDVTIQRLSRDTNAPSKKLLEVKSKVILTYQIIPDKAWSVYKKFRDQANKQIIKVESRIIEPLVHGTVKAEIGQYNEEELIAKRTEMANVINKKLADRLLKHDIRVDNFTIKDFSFSKTYTASIEKKQVAEQKAQQAKRVLARIIIEKEQKITQAEAEAKALELQKEQITPELLQLRQIEAAMKAIEKWDGVLPKVTSGAVPFIDVKSFDQKKE